MRSLNFAFHHGKLSDSQLGILVLPKGNKPNSILKTGAQYVNLALIITCYQQYWLKE